jgi:hypothetical protein
MLVGERQSEKTGTEFVKTIITRMEMLFGEGGGELGGAGSFSACLPWWCRVRIF